MGVKRWGESVGANYQAYYDWLAGQKVIKQKIDAKDVFTNELIDDINNFNAAEVVAAAKAYKTK
jgi:NitT/TauT family transport system substrate-binding protein